jgi:hypothetical protein
LIFEGCPRGDLDRITAWLMLYNNINADAGYPQTTLVMNPASTILKPHLHRHSYG